MNLIPHDNRTIGSSVIHYCCHPVRDEAAVDDMEKVFRRDITRGVEWGLGPHSPLISSQIQKTWRARSCVYIYILGASNIASSRKGLGTDRRRLPAREPWPQPTGFAEVTYDKVNSVIRPGWRSHRFVTSHDGQLLRTVLLNSRDKTYIHKLDDPILESEGHTIRF